ncbi:MAG: TlpA family protein disulfide reductase, partial [Pseudomonadota bacterium]
MSRMLIAMLLVFGLALPAGVQAGDGHPLKLLPAQAAVIGDRVPPAILDGRPVVVTFFASWCPPCTDEFKALN